LKLSVIIPLYNEEKNLETIIRKVISTGLADEIICVDDGSIDNSFGVLERMKDQYTKLKILRHKKNLGKGASIKTALDHVTGEIVLIQDADLEYDPSQYKDLLKPFENNDVQVVYGSRNLKKNPRSAASFYLGGVLLSKLSNLLYGSSITDESTGYKLFRTALLRDLNLTSKGFDFCPEVTSKILKRKIKITEIPISYTPRSKEEGKKIRWIDGLIAIAVLIKNRFN
jgi:glycosyltransferase involved in cell wall biosynthesis